MTDSGIGYVQNPVPDLEWRLLAPIIGEVRTMIELGNKKNKNGIFKKYFESIGIKHLSIDWNGKDGALKLDLNTRLWDVLFPADVVTNFGTSEHVEDQDSVFENIHHLSKKWMVHAVPFEGNWEGHGVKQDGKQCVRYSERFFTDLATKYHYTMEDYFIDGRPGKKLICVRFRHDSHSLHDTTGSG